MLHGIQYLHDSYKFLTPEQKELLVTNNPILQRGHLFVFDWFPIAANKEIDHSRNFSRIFRRRSRQNLHANDSMELRAPGSTIHSRPRSSSGRSVRLSLGLRSSDVMNLLRQSTVEGINDSLDSGEQSMVQEFEFRHISCWLFDPITNCAKSLLTSGTWNTTPIIYTFQYVFCYNLYHERLKQCRANANPLVMASLVMRLLNNTYKHNAECKPPLILVATYTKVSSNNRMLVQS